MSTIDKTDLVPLHSIGSVLDSKNGIIYPMNADGSADLSEGMSTNINDIDRPTLCFHCSKKDFNSIISSFLHRAEMEVYNSNTKGGD